MSIEGDIHLGITHLSVPNVPQQRRALSRAVGHPKLRPMHTVIRTEENFTLSHGKPIQTSLKTIFLNGKQLW